MPAMHKLSTRQWTLLVLLTLVWGVNWPIMKAGVTGFAPLTFRLWCLWLGVPVLALVLWQQKLPFKVERAHWPEVLKLAFFNMVLWHSLIIVAVQSLSSGRAAILGYTMPIFSAVLGATLFSDRLPPRAWLGVAAAAGGVVLLLWHELANLGGRPVGVLLALGAAAAWAMGTQLLRRTKMPAHTLTLAFWMSVITSVSLTVLAWLFEREQWHAMPAHTLAAVIYNAVMVIGFAHSVWFYLARSLPPIASTLSVMMIPIVGVFSGALWLGEVLHWQDWSAIALVLVAIASVLWPRRAA